MHETMIASTETTVRAGVNEKKLFSSLKHMFSSSTSFIGELMQNARRAGASRVEFTISPEQRTVVVSDDGCGIRDFRPLVTFAESDWDEQTMLSDRPFGMGLFSVLFACEQITFESCGQRLQVDIDSVVNRRPLRVEQWPTAPAMGTRITLAGVQADLVQHQTMWIADKQLCPMAYALLNLAAGFPIPVVVDGQEQPRPHAKDSLSGEITSVGFVSDPMLQCDQSRTYVMCRESSLRLYLQGLPIDRRNKLGPSDTDIVVHLDDAVFKPTMPDRAHLYDSFQARTQIWSEVKAARVRFLRHKKATLSGRDFVALYWDSALALSADDLVADLPWVPAYEFNRADLVAREHEDPFAPFVGVQREPGGEVDHLVSRDDLCSGRLKAWINGPYTVSEYDEMSGAAVLMMILEDIYMVDRVPTGHWLNDVCPRYADLVVAVIAGAASAEARYSGHRTCESVTIEIVPHVDIRVTSLVDPAYKLEQRVTTGWVLTQDAEDEDADECNQAKVYVCDGDQSVGHPVNALASFVINDVFDEDLQRDCHQQWDSIVSALRGESVGQVIRASMANWSQIPMKEHLGKLAIIRVAMEKRPADEQIYRWACDDLDQQAIDQLAAAFDGADPGLTTSERLQLALASLQG